MVRVSAGSSLDRTRGDRLKPSKFWSGIKGILVYSAGVSPGARYLETFVRGGGVKDGQKRAAAQMESTRNNLGMNDGRVIVGLHRDVRRTL